MTIFLIGMIAVIISFFLGFFLAIQLVRIQIKKSLQVSRNELQFAIENIDGIIKTLDNGRG